MVRWCIHTNKDKACRRTCIENERKGQELRLHLCPDFKMGRWEAVQWIKLGKVGAKPAGNCTRPYLRCKVRGENETLCLAICTEQWWFQNKSFVPRPGRGPGGNGVAVRGGGSALGIGGAHASVHLGGRGGVALGSLPTFPFSALFPCSASQLPGTKWIFPTLFFFLVLCPWNQPSRDWNWEPS